MDLYSSIYSLLSQIVETLLTFNKKIKKLFFSNRKSIEYRLNYVTVSWWIKVARKNFFPTLCETRKIEIMKEFYQESASVERDDSKKFSHFLFALARSVQIIYAATIQNGVKEYHEYEVNSEEFTEQERNYHGMHSWNLALLQVFHGWIDRRSRVLQYRRTAIFHIRCSFWTEFNLSNFSSSPSMKIEERTVFDNNIILSFASSIFHILADPLIRVSFKLEITYPYSLKFYTSVSSFILFHLQILYKWFASLFLQILQLIVEY